MNRDTFMSYERFKEVSKAISNVETAMMTIYDNEESLKELEAIHVLLVEYKKNWCY